MRITVIGLGWLGIPLAQALQDLGHQVIGSTTSKEKKAEFEGKGMNVVQFKLNPHPLGRGFQKLFETDIAILGIPPRSKHQSGDFYLEQLKYLRALLENSIVKKVIFISSTGVYPKKSTSEVYQEQEKITSETSGNPILLRAESIFQTNGSFESTLIRFGGLMGADRIPIAYFSGKENVDGDSRVNYIHQWDAIRMIEWIISNKLWNQCYNGVAPIHPKKRTVLESTSVKFGYPPPKSYLDSEQEAQRLIDAGAILETGFEFKFPDPLEFTYQKRSD